MNQLRIDADINIIREEKNLNSFLSIVRARMTVRFSIVKVYMDKACRKLKCIYNRYVLQIH